MLVVLSIIFATCDILFLLWSLTSQVQFNLIIRTTDLEEKTKLNLALSCKTACELQ